MNMNTKTFDLKGFDTYFEGYRFALKKADEEEEVLLLKKQEEEQTDLVKKKEEEIQALEEKEDFEGVGVG